MKPRPDCYPCFLRQAHIAARLTTKDEGRHLRVQKEISGLLNRTDFSKNPPFIATLIFRKTYEVLGAKDPYLGVKREYNRKVKALFPALAAQMKRSKDRFATAVRLALAGNIIDFGILEKFDLQATIDETLRARISPGAIRRFRQKIKNARSILYIADNAGEIGFDSFLLDEIRLLNPSAELVLAVKGAPVINDATTVDARYFGLHKKAHLIDTGGAWVGTHPSLSSKVFSRAFAAAGCIISKGQANWESLEELGDPRITFLLKAKCPIVATALAVRLNDIVIAANP
jgi:uncharacterized protein with ATP-grasp and redox domains